VESPDFPNAGERHASLRVLVVDDHDDWRRFVSRIVASQPEWRVIGEASDGLEAVQMAEQLQPDLILLDIGLPKLNGLEAARQIRAIAPTAKILCVSENRSRDIAEAALANGAGGYVVKADAGSELVPAIKTVLDGKRFVSPRLLGQKPNGFPEERTDSHSHNQIVALPPLQNAGVGCRHVAGFYSDDARFLDDLTQFVGAALKDGDAVVVIATESHRESLLPKLQAYGVDLHAAVQQGRYFALDAAEALAEFMVNDVPNVARFLELVSDLIVTATEAASSENGHVSLYAECVQLLCAQGNAEAAIQMEKIGKYITEIHNVDILCGYFSHNIEGGVDGETFNHICAEHSAFYSR